MSDTLQLVVELPNNSNSQKLLKRMSDMLQVVGNIPNTQLHRSNSTLHRTFVALIDGCLFPLW